jgi:hypothetical protein
MKSKSEITNEIDELEKKQKSLLELIKTDDDELYEVRRQKHLLAGQEKELMHHKENHTFVYRQNAIDLRLKKSEFWTAHDSGT